MNKSPACDSESFHECARHRRTHTTNAEYTILYTLLLRKNPREKNKQNRKNRTDSTAHKTQQNEWDRVVSGRFAVRKRFRI